MFFNTFKSFSNFLRNISILALAISFIYSLYSYVYFLDINHVPELTNQSQIHGEYFRVKVASVKILPEFYQTIIGKDTTFIALITTDKKLSFISPLSDKKISSNKIEAGSTLVFGASNPEGDKIERKSSEIQKNASKYTENKNSDIVYFQGQNVDTLRLFHPFFGTVGIIALIYYFKYKKDEKIEKQRLQTKVKSKKDDSEVIQIFQNNDKSETINKNQAK